MPTKKGVNMMLSRIVLAFIVCMVSQGCEPTNLYVAHDVVVGVNAQVSPDRQEGRLIIGYDRDFVTIIPKSVQVDGGSDRDVMSLLGCTELTVGGIFLSSYTDSLATGEAAKLFAMKVGEDDRFFDCHEQATEQDGNSSSGAAGGSP